MIKNVFFITLVGVLLALLFSFGITKADTELGPTGLELDLLTNAFKAAEFALRIKDNCPCALLLTDKGIEKVIGEKSSADIEAMDCNEWARFLSGFSRDEGLTITR